MVEYGQAVGQASGAGGHNTGAGGTQDLGAGAAAWVSHAVHTVSTMPPGTLLLIGFAIVVGLVLLRKVI